LLDSLCFPSYFLPSGIVFPCCSKKRGVRVFIYLLMSLAIIVCTRYQIVSGVLVCFFIR
jgi:hypothetical protein